MCTRHQLVGTEDIVSEDGFLGADWLPKHVGHEFSDTLVQLGNFASPGNLLSPLVPPSGMSPYGLTLSPYA